MAVAAVPGAILGSYLTTEVSGQVIGLLIGVFLVFVAWQMASRKGARIIVKIQKLILVFLKKNCSPERKACCLGLFSVFLLVYVVVCLSIPGVLLVPIMVLVLRMPFKTVAATSVFTMVFISSAGVAQHIGLGNINLEYALLIGSGSMFGGLIGVHLCKITKSQTLRWVLAGLLLFISLQMFLKFGLGFNY